mgnify:CR=1 FL=1
MTKRKVVVRQSDLRAALAALQDAGLHPKTLDILPDGTMRWHFVEPGDAGDDEVECELAAWRKKRGYG